MLCANKTTSSLLPAVAINARHVPIVLNKPRRQTIYLWFRWVEGGGQEMLTT